MGKTLGTGRIRSTGKVPGIGSIILIGGGIVMIMAIIGLVVTFTGVIETTYLELVLETPGFDYKIVDGKEQGNETFEAFVLMRWISMFLFALVLIVAAISKVFEASDAGIMQPGTANRMISKSLLFILIIVVFPPIWDGATEVVKNVSLWILNPLYSFDADSPCPANWTQRDIALAYEDSPYKKTATVQDSGGSPTGQPHSDVCTPKFKVTYVFGQMLQNTEVPGIKEDLGIVDPSSDVNDIIDAGTGTANSGRFGGTQGIQNNYLGGLVESVTKGTEGVFINVFLGLTKALIAIQILVMSVLLGILADMLVGMVIAGLPIFLMLSLIPKADIIANKMLDTIPALLLLPLMSSIILVVGAGSIAEAATNAVEVEGWGYLYVWITAIGVVFFAVTLPVIMIPLLGTVSQMASQTVSSAIQTGGVMTAMTAQSAAGSAIAARRGGAGMLGTLGAGAAGLAKGGLAGHGSISVPGFGGADFTPHPERALQAGGSQDLGMSIGEQRRLAGDAIANSMTIGQTRSNADDVIGSGMVTSPANYGADLEADAKAINKELAGFDYEQATPEQQAIYEAWRGPVGMAAESGIGITQGQLHSTVDLLKQQNDDTVKGVSDRVIRDGFVKMSADMAGIEKHVLERFIRQNPVNTP